MRITGNLSGIRQWCTRPQLDEGRVINIRSPQAPFLPDNPVAILPRIYFQIAWGRHHTLLTSGSARGQAGNTSKETQSAQLMRFSACPARPVCGLVSFFGHPGRYKAFHRTIVLQKKGKRLTRARFARLSTPLSRGHQPNHEGRHGERRPPRYTSRACTRQAFWGNHVPFAF